MTASAPQEMTCLRVATVQMKFAPSISENLTKIERATRQAVRRGADAVLFPECATTGYAIDFKSLRPPAVTETLQAVAGLAKRYRVNLLVGSAVFRGRRLQNCLVVFDREGQPVHCYAKCQFGLGLVPHPT